MYATFHVNTKGIIESTPRRRLASGAMEPLEGHPFFLDARWWRELATFLEGTPFREKMARLSFCAVLARLLWPTQLTTDLLAGQAFGVQVRQMTRWNTRIAELTASICQAAGIDQATWAIPAKIKAIGSSSSAGPSSTLPSSPRRELRMPTMYVTGGSDRKLLKRQERQFVRPARRLEKFSNSRVQCGGHSLTPYYIHTSGTRGGEGNRCLRPQLCIEPVG